MENLQLVNTTLVGCCNGHPWRWLIGKGKSMWSDMNGMRSARSGRIVEAGHKGGIHTGVGESTACGITGMIFIGSSDMSTLGWLGAGMWVRDKEGGPRRLQDSKRLCRLAMVSTWEMHVGRGASLKAPDMTCRPWMILSSAEGDGIVQ